MRIRYTSLAQLACAGILLLVTASCIDEPAADGDDAAEAASVAPPIAFDAEPVSVVSSTFAHFIDGSNFYGLELDGGTSPLIRVIDLKEQNEIGQAVPEHDRDFLDVLYQEADVAFARTGDEVILVHAYEADGSVFLRAFNADDGSLRYTATAVPELSYSIQQVSVVQADSKHVLMVADGNTSAEDGDSYSSAVSFLIATDTGEIVWEAENFAAIAFDGEHISGISYAAKPGIAPFLGTAEEFQVVRLDGHEPSYFYATDHDLDVSWIGGGVVLIEDGDSPEVGFGDDGYRALLVNTATAEVLVDAVPETTPFCEFDQVAVIGCVGLGEPGLAVFDAADGTVMWTGSDIQDYLPPDRFLASYQGVFYMDNAEGGRPPVAIEAATGKQLAEELPMNLVEIGPDYAVTSIEEFGGWTVSIYRVTERHGA